MLHRIHPGIKAKRRIEMSCYLLPMGKPDRIYKIHILRFNPEKDQKPHWESYQIPYVDTMTVMEALEYLWDQGEYVAFRSNCREFTCGSCAMLINGKPSLACDTLLKDKMKLEPLSRYAVVKDLNVDAHCVKENLSELKYWPVTKKEKHDFTVTEKVREEFDSIYTRCIECKCCLEACPASSLESKFKGPMYFLLLGRAKKHPLDDMDRVQQTLDLGLWSCMNCLECADVCPVNLNPSREIRQFHKEAIKNTLVGFFISKKRQG